MLRFSFKLAIVILGLLMAACTHAATLAVVFPKVSAPRDAVYNQIIEGITGEYSGKVELVPVPQRIKKADAVKFALEVESLKPSMVIVLGSSGRKVGRRLKQGVPWVSGASLIRPNGSAGITPLANPTVMFENLKVLAPQVKRIYVVYSKRNQWLIELSQAAALAAGYEFYSYSVDSTTAALSQYDELIRGSLTKNDAIWLPVDKYSSEKKNVVPMIIRKAWEKRFVVFSSRPEFVRRGVLFSFMPDHEVTGSELVKMVQSIYSKTLTPQVKTTSVVNLAVNLRTASHLGLEYTPKQKGRFLLTFPNQ